MKMNKTLIHGAVGAALALGLGLPSIAQAYQRMLIPYVVKDTSRTTIVTLIGRGQNVSSGTTLHLQYWTKSTTDANTAACQPNSSTMTFTEQDMVSFDTAGLLGYPLFGDTTNSSPLPPTIGYAGPRHGYLVVEWMNKHPFAGYWLEVDLANGGAHGDWAMGGASADDFSLADDHVSLVVGEIFSDVIIGGPHAVAFWPTSVATSVFTVTPLGTAMSTNENNQVVMHVRNSSNVQGVYDRNENGLDGVVTQTVRCVGRLTLAQLMPGILPNASWAASGGWGWLTNLGDGDTNYTEGPTQDLPAVVYQVDTGSGTGAGTFLQNAARIVSNTFVQEKENVY